METYLSPTDDLPPPPGSYAAWYQTAEGTFALAAALELLRKLSAGWPRRSRSILVMQPGVHIFLTQLWEAGFDVTAVESDQASHAYLCSQGNFRFTYTLSSPDHLPYDDNTFDYALCFGNPDYWKSPVPFLQEVNRVCCNGCLLLFPSAWSIFALDCRLRRFLGKPVLFPGTFVSPYTIGKAAAASFPDATISCYSTLPLPPQFWVHCKAQPMAGLVMRGPFGALAGIKIDRNPRCTGTAIPICSGQSLVSAD